MKRDKKLPKYIIFAPKIAFCLQRKIWLKKDLLFCFVVEKASADGQRAASPREIATQISCVNFSFRHCAKLGAGEYFSEYISVLCM